MLLADLWCIDIYCKTSLCHCHVATSQMCNFHAAISQSVGWALWGVTGWRPSAAARPDWGRGRALRLGHTSEVAAWEIAHLGICHSEKCLWEVLTEEKSSVRILTSNRVRYIQYYKAEIIYILTHPVYIIYNII